MIRIQTQIGTLLISTLAGCFSSAALDGADASSPDVGDFDAATFDIQSPDAGVDSGPIETDAGPIVMDAGLPLASCNPQDARPGTCAVETCDTLGPAPRVYWNGHSCESLGCGRGEDCIGTDCGATYGSMEICEMVHNHCAAIQCRDGGGMWRFWGDCDCGFACGVNGNCRACEGPSCDCGAFANFVPGEGCVNTDECVPPPFVEPPLEMCERTGGEWGSFCSPSQCGVRSNLECTAMACDCPGPTEWDEVRGCVETDRCYRGAGRCDSPGVVCPLGTECGGRDGFCFPVCVDG